MKLSMKPQAMISAGTTVRRFTLVAAMLLGSIFSNAVCRATTFDWPASPAWGTSPTTGNTETVNYGYYVNGSLSVSVLNSPGGGVGMNTGYPQVFAGGSGIVNGGTANNALILYNLSATSTSAYTQVTIVFQYSGGVNNVSFNLWDVDMLAGQFTDKISSISATAVGGGTVYPTTFTGSANNAISGSGATLAATGTGNAVNNTNTGNVNIAFTQTISSLTFRWSNVDAGLGPQAVGISPITFTAVGTAFPEVNSSSAALFLCGGVMGLGLLRRRSRNEEISKCLARV